MKRAHWLIAVALFAMSAIPAHAWIITQVEPNPLAGQAVGIATRLAGPAGTDVFEIDKYFMVDPNAAASPLPLTLRFVREPGDQNLISLPESILNLQVSQDRVWTDFHVSLSTDVSVTHEVGEVVFVGPGLAYAWQQAGGASRLGGLPSSYSYTRIDWLNANPGQVVPPGGPLDVPENQLVLSGLVLDVSGLSAGDGFLLREWPTVPEPATLALLAAGGLGLLLRRRKTGTGKSANAKAQARWNKGKTVLRGLMIVGLGLLLAGSLTAATITQTTPADSQANADWTITYEANFVDIGLRCDYLTPSMLNTPVVLQFVLDANDFMVTGAPKQFRLVNYDNPADGNVVMFNSTGLTWRDFHFYLVNMPVGTPMYAGASFANRSAITSDPFGAPVSSTASQLDFANGVVDDANLARFRNIAIDHAGSAGSFFLLKMQPAGEPDFGQNHDLRVFKYFDKDGQGDLWNDGNYRLSDWTIRLDGSQQLQTLGDGSADFGLQAGTHAVSEVLQSGWQFTSARIYVDGNFLQTVTDANLILVNMTGDVDVYLGNIPEPMVLSILAIGGMAVLRWRRRR